MADSRRKLNMPRLRPVKPLEIPEIEADRDETVGCLRYTVLAAIILLLLAIVAVVTVFVLAQIERQNSAAGNAAPPAGVTVAVKRTDPALTAPEVLKAHQDKTGQTVAGFAIDLGSARSFSELSKRFGEIALQNAELQFDRLEPRATLGDTIDGIEARLLVGPFETLAQAIEACRNIALPSGIECKAVNFAGEKIARE